MRRHVVRVADGPGDIAAAQGLRGAVFGMGRSDSDAFDANAIHMLIEDRREDCLAGCFRMLPLASGADIETSYSAQVYDLGRLARYPHPMTELGRFCIDPAAAHPDILRVAWGAITAHVDAADVGMLFGCTSFDGTDPGPHRPALAALSRHIAPTKWAPGPRAPQRVALGGQGVPASLRGMPPLLRTYLGMGGWVSDHAVVDSAMNTLHVFTGVEIAAIPTARRQRLRAALDGGGAAG